MAARKRAKENAEESPPPKRQKRGAAPIRPTRNSIRKTTSLNESARQSSRQGNRVAGDDGGELSDSSSLSDPPSTVASPTPPDSPIIKPVARARRVVAAKRRAVKVSAKEHEEALNLFVRESSDEESDSSSEKAEVNKTNQHHEHSDEDNDAWEDVDLSRRKELSLDDLNMDEDSQDLEVTLERTQQSMRLKNKAASAAEKKIRMHSHLLHVQCLLVHGGIRNAWLEDEELQKILSSRFPDLKRSWKTHFSSQQTPDEWLAVLEKTVERFRSQFIITKPGMRKMGYRDLSLVDKDDEAKYFGKFEHFDSMEDFRKAAKGMKGSRDFGAQIFTALLRSFGVETRLVFSFQPLGFNFGKLEDAHRLDRRKDDLDKDVNEIPEEPVEKEEKKKSRKRRRLKEEESDDEEDLGLPRVASKAPTPDSDLKFPIFWSEVYVEGKWIPIDALTLNLIATEPDQIAKFEPRGKVAEEKKLVMGYVVAYDSEHYARDVTVRYVKNFPGKAKRWRIREFAIRELSGQMVMYDWFKRTLGPFRRNEKTDQDLIEDAELTVKPPTPKEVNMESLSYYKNHPKYVLERHLRREEALKPGSKAVRKFASGKGEKAKEEIVYNRSDVYICRTVENWYKEGKKVKEGETPMKQVKPRPMTLARKREHEIAMAENDDQPIMEGLYAAHQVEVYLPPPIENGVIPKNGYGNIDLFVDSMLPPGAVHLPYRGTAKVAKRLGFDFAEAITGFEFKKQRAIPLVGGIVVAAENEEMVLDAWREDEEIRLEKEATKKQKEVLARWKKFLVGLRIRQRINHVYGAGTSGEMSGS